MTIDRNRTGGRRVTPDLFADIARAFLRHWPPFPPRPFPLHFEAGPMSLTRVTATPPPLPAGVAHFRFIYSVDGAAPVTVDDVTTDPVVFDVAAGASVACHAVAVGVNGVESDASPESTEVAPDFAKPDAPASFVLTFAPAPAA